jgi:hypothetical protein
MSKPESKKEEVAGTEAAQTATHIAIWKNRTWKVTDARSAEVASHDDDILAVIDTPAIVRAVNMHDQFMIALEDPFFRAFISSYPGHPNGLVSSGRNWIAALEPAHV